MTLPIRAFVLGTGLLVPLGGCGGRGTEGPLQANTAPKAVTVTVAPLEHRAVDRTVEVVGTLKGWEDVTVGSKQTGRVARVFHDMGDRVQPGELLAELDSTGADAGGQSGRASVPGRAGQARTEGSPLGRVRRGDAPGGRQGAGGAGAGQQ